MKNAEMKIVRFNEADVVATSGLCSRDGNALRLIAYGGYYEAGGIVYSNEGCGWIIGDKDYDACDTNPFGDVYKCNDIFMSGEKIPDEYWGALVYTDLWYHFENGNYYICNNIKHQ